jgi:hypothetical protein
MADQTHALSGADAEVDTGQGPDGAEALFDAVQSDYRCACLRRCAISGGALISGMIDEPNPQCTHLVLPALVAPGQARQ